MNLGVKEGEGVCSKGAYFWELTVHPINNPCVYKACHVKNRKMPSITQDEHLGGGRAEEQKQGGMGNVDGDDIGCRKEEIKREGEGGQKCLHLYDLL